jgi:hypothetical protein
MQPCRVDSPASLNHLATDLLAPASLWRPGEIMAFCNSLGF